MSTFITIAAVVVVLITLLILKIRRRYNAAMNVLMARYTFDRLTRDEQKQVKEEAKQLVLGKGIKIEGYAHDVERYGWYAVAMKALNIPSKLPENPNWFSIKNPTKAIKRGDVFLRSASGIIKQNYSIDIAVN